MHALAATSSLSAAGTQAEWAASTSALPANCSFIVTQALHIFDEGKNVLINEVDGSGKTLAYLLPVINRILHSKKDSPRKKGAVILTLNKELALSIYRFVRLLDFDNILSVCRSGSITHYSPVIDEMVLVPQRSARRSKNKTKISFSILWISM